MHYLYRITDTTNDRVYIGQTMYPVKRWKEHLKKSPKLQVDIIMKSKGYENFTFEVICTCKTIDNANDLEELLIIQYKSLITENGYNILKGGRNKLWTPEMKQRHSEIKKEQAKTQIYSEEFRAAASARSAARRKTQDEINRQRESMKQAYQNDPGLALRKACKAEKNGMWGEAAPNRKFDSETLEQIKIEFESKEISNPKLAKKYNCGLTTFRRLIKSNFKYPGDRG